MLTNHVCKCDSCGATEKFNNWSFASILAAVRRKGWRVTKVGDGWKHYCAECVAKWNKPDATPKAPPPAPAERPEMWWQRD